MGIAALILGIISLIICWIPVWNWAGLVMAIAGIVLGALGKKSAKPGPATAGLVLSILGVVFSVIFVLACGGLACLGAAA